MEDEEKAMQVRVDYKKFVFATPEIEEPVRKLASERRLATLLTICLLYLIVCELLFSRVYLQSVHNLFISLFLRRGLLLPTACPRRLTVCVTRVFLPCFSWS